MRTDTRRAKPRTGARLLRAGCQTLLTAAALGLCSCRSNPEWVAPPVDIPASFSDTPGAEMPAEWWTSFGDDALNALMAQAMAGNFELRVAWDRLAQAQAATGKSAAAFWPGADVSAGATRSVTRPGPDIEREYASGFSLGAAVSYELDLWGRVRSTHDAAALDVAATQQDIQTAAMTLSANLARTWYQLLERRGQLALVREQIAVNERYLEAITLRFRRGQVGATDVLQQQQLVEAISGDRILIESEIAVLENQLAILVGRAPSEFQVESPGALPALPPFPATGVPAVWMRRRPDLQAAELRVRAADRRVAAALADRFPRISLSASGSTEAGSRRDLFDSWGLGLASNLALPLIDGGQRRAEVRRTEAVVSERLNQYAQVVLTALREVEDAIGQEARQREYLQSLHEQLAISQKAQGQTLKNYAKGTADFTRYLTAVLSYQNLQRSDLQAQRDLVLFRIDLYRALAGGWMLDVPPPATVPSDTHTRTEDAQ